MNEPIRINRAAREKFWADSYNRERRRGRRLGWMGAILLLAAILGIAVLVDGCAGRPPVRWNGPRWRVPVKVSMGPVAGQAAGQTAGAIPPRRHR
jgi:hypothetical protein